MSVFKCGVLHSWRTTIISLTERFTSRAQSKHPELLFFVCVCVSWIKITAPWILKRPVSSVLWLLPLYAQLARWKSCVGGGQLSRQDTVKQLRCTCKGLCKAWRLSKNTWWCNDRTMFKYCICCSARVTIQRWSSVVSFKAWVLLVCYHRRENMESFVEFSCLGWLSALKRVCTDVSGAAPAQRQRAQNGDRVHF